MTAERILMLAAHLEIEYGFVEECVRCGAVHLEADPETGLDAGPNQLARLRRLHRICRSLEIEVFAGSIIVDLLERMDALQLEIQRTRS